MPDPILGPNGQPLPNPFLQGQNKPVNINVDMGQAQQALDNFTSRLETTLTRLFNFREKSLKNIHAGEKGYWDMATNYANTYYGILNRQHDIRMQKLKDEQSQKENMIRRDVANEEDAQKQILKVREQYAIKANQLKKQHAGNTRMLEGAETIFGGVSRAASIALPGAAPAIGELGGLISAAASGTMFFSAALVAATAATKAWTERQAELSRSASGLVSAGFGLGTSRASVEGLRKTIFGQSFDTLLSPTEQRAGLGAMGQAPALLNEAAQHTERFERAMFMFGNIMPNSTELIEMFARNSKDLGLNLNEIAGIFDVTRLASMKMSHSQKEWNINQKDTIDIFVGLQKSFRNFTTDGTVAAGTLLGLSGFLRDFAKGPEERKQFAGAIGGGISNLKFSQLAGMYAFTHGGNLPTEGQAFGANGSFSNAPQLMGSFLKGITSQFGAGSQQAFMAKGALQEQFFPGLPMRLIPKFDELVKALESGRISNEEASQKMYDLDKETRDPEAKGRKALTDATGALAQINNKLFNVLNEALNNPQKVRGVVEDLSGVGLVRRAAETITDSVSGARHK